VEVIGAGFPRTGTSSLKASLQELGFGPCYHMSELLRNPDRVRQWDAMTNGDADWTSIFNGYRSAVDFPAAAYWRELAAHYPNAKIILTLRDHDRWYESMASTVMRAQLDPVARTVSRLVALGNPSYRTWFRWDNRLHDTFFEGDFAERSRVLKVFDRHIAEVQAEIPADRLLVFDVAQGWEPLCEFLGVPVPDRPFPSVNDSAQFSHLWWRRMARLSLDPVLGMVGLLLGAGLWSRRRRGWRRAPA
jgi:hypothetical protein